MQFVRFFSYLVAAVVFSLSATNAAFAQGENSISFRAGSFTPWKGTTGSSATFQYTHRIGDRHHLGFEFAFRDFEGEVGNIKDTGLQQYILGLFYRADLLLDRAVTPYVGARVGPGVNEFDRRPIEETLSRRNPGSKYDTLTAAVLDLTGVVGVDVAVPNTDWLTLFTEARFSYTAQITNLTDENIDRDRSLLEPRETDRSEDDHAGGVAVQAGVRFRF